MTLDEALQARAQALREGHIDCEAINRLCELLPGDDPRHPLHSISSLAQRAAQNVEDEVFRIMGD